VTGWSRRFYEPIELPNGALNKIVKKRRGDLRTLRDAAEFIAALPAEESAQQHWQTAIRELMISAERGGILMLSEIAMKVALSHGREEPEKPPRKKAVKRYRVVR